MDVEKVRKAANWCRIYGGANDKCTANALLRILDAFEVMEQQGWKLAVFDDYSWHVVDDCGYSVASGDTPLAALLAAADKLKGASDADSK